MNEYLLYYIFTFIDYPTACAAYKVSRTAKRILEELKRGNTHTLWKYELFLIDSYCSRDLTLEYTLYSVKSIVKRNPMSIREFTDFQSTELCEVAIDSDPFVIGYVMDEYVTDSLLIRALELDSRVICILPPQLFNKNEALMIMAVRADPSMIMELEYTDLVAKEALRVDWQTIYYIERQSPDVASFAIDQNWKAIEGVKDQTFKLCQKAVRKSEQAKVLIRDKRMRERFKPQPCVQQ